jgi:predicted HNH restriction endonuclease
MTVYQLQNVPTVEDYVTGLQTLGDKVTELQRGLLVAQYQAPDRTVTSPELAEAANVNGGRPAVNAAYGRLGRRFCELTGLIPDLRPDDTHRWWSTWSDGYSDSSGFHWQMHPEVAEALEQLGWVATQPMTSASAVSIDLGPPARTTMTTNRIIRDSTLARHIKTLHNWCCQICGTQLQLPDGRFYAEAHHLKPLGHPHDGPDIAENLLVVCPNHHALCDFGAITIDEGRLTQHTEHQLAREYLDYHNQQICFDE